MRWKEYLDYEKNRDTNVNKIYNKLGMDIGTVTKNSEAQLYTPNADKNKDVSMWLTRNNKDDEAERVRKLQEISDNNKANIDKIVAESKTKKVGSSNNAGLNPLGDENNTSKGSKKGVGQIAHDFFIGGIDDDGNDKFMKLFGVDWKAPESQINYQKSQQAKKDTVANVLSENGYLEKGATDEEANEYYSNLMKDMGYSDEDINKSLGFGGEVALNKGFLGKVNSSIRNAIAPDSDDVLRRVVSENEKSRGSKLGNFASGLVGNTIGLAMNPGGGTAQGTTLLNAADNFAEGVASKVAPKLGNSIAGKVGTNAIRGAVDGGIGGVLDTLRGDDSENLVSNIASGALGGALMFGGSKALGESVNAYNSFKSGLPELNSVKEGGVSSFTPFTKVETQIKDKDLDGLLKGTDETLSSDPNLKLPFEVVKKSDIKNNVPLSNEVAATVGPNINASKFANDTVLNSNQADDILKEAIEDQGISYERLTNKETLENARKIVNENPKKARNIISNGNKIDAETMAIGQELILKYQQEGRYDEAIDLLEDISERGTKAGQAIQALSMWKRLTPEGMLSYAQRKINKYNSSVGSNKGVKLSEDNAKTIVEAMQEVNKMEDGRAKDIELAKVNQYINDLIPSSFEDKIDSFRYINMLFNPKTMIKNVGGNVINTGIGSVRDTIGSGIDRLISNKTGIRTTGLPNFGAMGEGFKKGVKETIEDYKNGIDTSMELKDGARGNALRDIPLLGKAEKLTGFGLKLGDTPFYEAKSNEFLQNYMKLNGIDDVSKLPAEVLEEANRVGLEATYQQKTGLGDAVNNLKNSKFTPLRLLTKSILPFSQTPSAILDTSLNYTPIGALRGARNISKALSSDNVGEILSSQRKGVNQLASGILGTGLIGAGYELADRGALTGSLSKDKDISNLQRQTGMQPYALKTGDTYNSLEFAQPAASPLMIGADMAQGNLNPLKSAVNSILGNSYLSGLQSAISAAGNADNGEELIEFGKQAVKNYTSQLLPFGTLANQINKTLDPTVKDTYSSNEIAREVKKAMSKYPGLSKILPQGIDTVGEGKVYNEGQGLGTAIFNNFLNPSTMSYYNPSEVEANALDMYYETGDTIQAPSYHSGSVTNKGQTYNLTDEEMREYSARIAHALQYAEKTPKGYAEAMQKEGDKFRKEIIEKYKLK